MYTSTHTLRCSMWFGVYKKKPINLYSFFSNIQYGLSLLPHLLLYWPSLPLPNWALCIFPSYDLYLPDPVSSSLPYPPPWYLFIFLVSEITPGYMLMSEELELGSTNEREHTVFVFPGLDWLLSLILVLTLWFSTLWEKELFSCI